MDKRRSRRRKEGGRERWKGKRTKSRDEGKGEWMVHLVHRHGCSVFIPAYVYVCVCALVRVITPRPLLREVVLSIPTSACASPLLSKDNTTSRLTLHHHPFFLSSLETWRQLERKRGNEERSLSYSLPYSLFSLFTCYSTIMA